MSDGRILIAGGSDVSLIPLSSTELFDPYTGRIEAGPELKHNHPYAAAALLNNSVYICGGSPNGWRSSLFFDSCERLTANQSTKIQPMNQKRCGLAMVAFENKLYAFGGFADEGADQKFSSVESYDPNIGSWSFVKPMPTARAHMAASVLSNRIYVCGGMSVDWHRLHVCEGYDPVGDEWKTIANMMKARVEHCLLTVNGRLYAIGGTFYDAPTRVEVYDPNEDKWSPHPPTLHSQRQLSSAVVLPGMYGIAVSTFASSMPRKTIEPTCSHTGCPRNWVTKLNPHKKWLTAPILTGFVAFKKGKGQSFLS